MKRVLPVISTLLLLAACETNQQDEAAIKAQASADAQTAQGNVERNGMRVANNVRDQVKKTSMKMREWWLTPLPVNEPTAVPPSYCYKVLQDINCYRQPLPGAEPRLVGFQGDLAPEPPIAQTQPLPTIPQNFNKNAAPAARIVSAKPIFIAPPTPVKEEKQTVDALQQVGSEPLPDPMSSPQL